jgi:hypothetical protein
MSAVILTWFDVEQTVRETARLNRYVDVILFISPLAYDWLMPLFAPGFLFISSLSLF